jgi:DNA-binding response OmpR family regulator
MRDGKVLIVEDDDDLRDLVRTVVEREGMATIEAADGREGLRQFYEHRPSLLILDIGLPELDGWQVLERVRELGDVPVLILTAASDELDKVRGLRQGADDYVTKPFGRQELIARVEALLRRAGDSEVATRCTRTASWRSTSRSGGSRSPTRSSTSPPRSSASWRPSPGTRTRC